MGLFLPFIYNFKFYVYEVLFLIVSCNISLLLRLVKVLPFNSTEIKKKKRSVLF